MSFPTSPNDELVDSLSDPSHHPTSLPSPPNERGQYEYIDVVEPNINDEVYQLFPRFVPKVTVPTTKLAPEMIARLEKTRKLR